MSYFFIFIPLLSALVSWLSITVFLFIFMRRVIPAKRPTLRQVLMQVMEESMDRERICKTVEQLDLRAHITPLVDARLDRLIDQFKPLIPMGEVLLSGALAHRLKQKAQDEILDAVPEIQSQLIRQMDFKQIIGQQLQRVNPDPFESAILSEMRPEVVRSKRWSVAIGFLLGVAAAPFLC